MTMHDSPIPPHDLNLTAYALGELEGDERAKIEAALRAHPELRETVAEIRAAAAQIEAALASEAGEAVAEVKAPRFMPRLIRFPAKPPAAVHRRRARSVEREKPDPYPAPSPNGRLVQFPQLYYVAGLLAAACFAVIVALNRDDFERRQQALDENARAAYARREVEARPASVQPGQLAVSVASRPAESIAIGDSMPPSAPLADPARAVANLALLEQARQVLPLSAPPAAAVVPDTVRRDTAVAVTRPAEAEPTGSSARAAGSPAGTPADLEVAPPAAANVASQVTAENLPPADVVTVVANTADAMAHADRLFAAPTGSFLAPVTGVAPVSDHATMPANGDDVVVLSAFTVQEKRDSFGSMTANRRRVASAELDQDDNHLPRPPAGAKFGRGAELDAPVRDNPFVPAAIDPVSTFAADVGTASYSTLRRLLAQRQLPTRDAVKIEEMVNYFPYRYAAPPPPRELTFWQRLFGRESAPPLAATLEVADAPWAPTHRLVRIGLRARDVAMAEREAANLVFLLDVSSSMNEFNRLPLVKESLRLLVSRLRPDDRVAIVTYGGSGGVALRPTLASNAREIVAAIDALATSGLADRGGGIRQAYELAQANFAEDRINRVILCTDGDFNLGAGSEGELLRLVQQKAESGVYLSVLGFGMGNYRDATLEKLARRGNGAFGYVDSRREAHKLLVEQVSSTLVTVARDVKLQVEFNPAKVASYRLIGYENRLLRREDFNLEHVDAGEIGAGHTVTALYEIVPVGAPGAPVNDAVAASRTWSGGDELLTVKVRYKKPDGLLTRSSRFALPDVPRPFAQASADFRFAAAVAQLGMILRGSEYRGQATIGDVIAWAAAAAANAADDPGGYRGEFIDLARQAQELLRGE
jgi:secreted protein with Ig-like and vWFA domain